MSNNKLSSIQQFWDKIALKLSVEQINEFVPLFKQAKAMHKDEMVKFALFFSHAQVSRTNVIDEYNETFGGNNE